MARNHVNKPLILNIYNSRQDEVRQVTIVPRTGWGGDGLLGCAIRFSPLDGVRDRVWHILVELSLFRASYVLTFIESSRKFTCSKGRSHRFRGLCPSFTGYITPFRR